MDLFLLKKNFPIETSLNYEEHIFIEIYYYFYELFKPLLNLQNYDKLGIIYYDNSINYNIRYVNIYLINFRFCIYKKNIIQPIIRWLNKQNRLNTFTKLDIIFSEYNTIIQKLKIFRNKYNNHFEQIYNKFNNLNNHLINKMNILIISYYSDNIISDCINRYINYLNILN
jgi:hypothetical protein